MSVLNRASGDSGGTLTHKDFEAAIKAMMRPPDAPPVLSRIYATHSVPHGRVFRMWTTRGEMVAYVNRGEVADMPRSPKPATCLPGIVGTPVVFE